MFFSLVLAVCHFGKNRPFYHITGHYVKDLDLLSRDLTQSIIIDNSPMSYIFHPHNSIDFGSFIDDPSDIEMWQLAGIVTLLLNNNNRYPYPHSSPLASSYLLSLYPLP